MIEVKHLTKRYGKNIAVKDLSFTVEDNEVYGFLGPNGAGKSTTMNIMTGYLSTDEGEVLINGHSIFEEPETVKAMIGYLPEQPPLYTDMTAYEYLMFVADLKKVAKDEKKAQIEKAMERTGVTDVKDRLIKNLSKGYRQRVGFAEALIGNPSVIILDEPTVGLDPAQIIEIRSLIRELGKEHTVILSSHILSEVSSVCDKVLIISKGELVACDTAENLEKNVFGGNTYTIEVKGSEEEVKKVLQGIKGIEFSKAQGGDPAYSRFEIKSKESEDISDKLFYAFAEARMPLKTLEKKSASLEDVFLEVTGNEPEKETSGKKKGDKK
ncbi:MAG: ABC transporter ATP-binding protein [Oscillospiraceae bacterium]